MNRAQTARLMATSLLLSTSMSYAASEIEAPEVYAHRGARSFAPENTMPGFEAALKIGTDWMDMDVVLTKDGQILVTHDPVLNPDLVRGSDGKFIAENKEALKNYAPEQMNAFNLKYAVKNLTLVQTQEFDVGRLNPTSDYAKYFPEQVAVDGTRMPTLRDVIRWSNRQTRRETRFQIEMKTDPTRPDLSADPKAFAEALYRVMKEEKIFSRSEIQAFDFRCLTELQKIDRRVKTAYLTSRDNEAGGVDDFFSKDAAVATRWTGGPQVKNHLNSIPRMIKAMGGYAWEPEDAQLTESTLREAHELGLKVVVWSWPEMLGTAFDPKLVTKMIDWGVDGIITDDPGRLISTLVARGKQVRCQRILKTK